jgi:hypothetical protein
MRRFCAFALSLVPVVSCGRTGLTIAARAPDAGAEQPADAPPADLRWADTRTVDEPRADSPREPPPANLRDAPAEAARDLPLELGPLDLPSDRGWFDLTVDRSVWCSVNGP